MKATQAVPQLKFHADAYRFVFEALQYTQERLPKRSASGPEDDSAHITGGELLDGVRELALRKFGLMARAVFAHWGVETTEDFGRIVFDLVERGEMRKTDRDNIGDFYDVYRFDEALDEGYEIPTDELE